MIPPNLVNLRSPFHPVPAHTGLSDLLAFLKAGMRPKYRRVMANSVLFGAKFGASSLKQPLQHFIGAAGRVIVFASEKM